MIPKFFRHRFWALITAGFFGVIGFGTFAHAQNSALSNSDTFTANTIDIPFDSEVDSVSMMADGFDQVDDPVEDSRVVIGSDDRQPVLSGMYPWSSMGRLEWQIEGNATYTCTATLIAPDAVLTNSHCLELPLPDESGEPVKTFISSDFYTFLVENNRDLGLKMVFKPSLIEGIALDEAEVVSYESGWSIDYNHPKDDWAVLKLSKSLGNTFGYMGWRNLDFEDQALVDESFEKINLLGYAGDFPTEALREFGEPRETAGVDLACSILGVWLEGPLEDMLIHDCDTNPGASGGPIFAKFTDDKYYLVGLHARHTPLVEPITLRNGVTTNVVNGGVEVSRWQAAAVWAVAGSD